MSDNWVVQNLQNTLGTWNEKLAEIWMFGYFRNIPTIQQSWTCVDKFADLYAKETG